MRIVIIQFLRAWEKRAREKYERRFDPARATERLLEVYRHAVQRQRVPIRTAGSPV